MKAAVVEEPGVLVVREVPEPTVGEYDALCEILYCATCSATDRHIIDGTFPFGMEYPAILGHESIGRVLEVGPKARAYQPGDVVTRPGATAHPAQGIYVGWGGYAERGIVRDIEAMRADGADPAGWQFPGMNQVVPPEFDPAAATMMVTWRETFSYLTRMGVGYNARVLVIGSGGNGLSYVNHAANLLASEIVLVGSPGRLETGREVGATDAWSYREEDLPAKLQERYPEGFDFIIDAVGKQGALNQMLPLIKAGGTVGVYGVDDWFGLTLTPNPPGKTFTFFNGGYSEAETTGPVVRFIRQGLLKAEPFLDLAHPFALAEINEAFAALERREMVKALVRIAG